MGLKEDIDAKNAKFIADIDRGKKGVKDKLTDKERLENIEKYLGWRDE